MKWENRGEEKNILNSVSGGQGKVRKWRGGEEHPRFCIRGSG